MNSTFEHVIFDIETNGLLPRHVEPPFCMDKIHCIGIKDINTGEVIDYVNNTEENDLELGVRILQKAKTILGHNIIDFDIPAIQLIFPWFFPEGRIIDTLVMARMCFSDVKDGDYRLAATGKLEGKLIGRQGLEAWGQRLGLHKGDYAKERENALKDLHRQKNLEPPTPEEIHYYTWGEWNEDMHDYCINDIEVNALLWKKIQEKNWSKEAMSIEHNIHALMVQQETNGFYFDKTGAERLGDALQKEYDDYAAGVIEAIGAWYKPAKVHKDDPREEYGEDESRRTWADVTIPKKTMNFSKSNEQQRELGKTDKNRPRTEAGAPYTKVNFMEFNPNSRPQIIDRLQVLYGWEPQDFTEKGNPVVDDEVLRNLEDHIPIANALAEIFYFKKRIAMVVDGKNGWLRLLRPDGRIHGRVNVGGTVSGRATHSYPNISQVPGVTPVENKNYAEGLEIIDRHKKAGTYIKSKWKKKPTEEDPEAGEWEIIVKGREGNHGWDCRELFGVPAGYKLVGCDLSGIEFRCLGNLTYAFDGGEIIDMVLNGDIHAHNAHLTGIGRGTAKRLLYACMYGGGDAKLGSIVEPLSSETRQRVLGKQVRHKLMMAMPSLSRAIQEIHKEMRRNNGSIAGLDGRRLYTRSKHSALNLRLQSDGALIAKKWCLLIDDMFYEEGWDHAVDKEYAFCSWSHDEVQVAVREDIADKAAKIMEAAAPIAGEYFKFNCPVEAKAVVGNNWAETH